MINQIKGIQCSSKRIFIIMDQNIDINYIHQYFAIQTEPSDQETTCLKLELYKHPHLGVCELYLFPKNREFKPYCELYSTLLPRPDVVLYAVDVQASIRQTVEWLNLFQNDIQTKLVFFSSAKSYFERKQILTKICTLFLQNITNQVFFPFLDESAFNNCLLNLGTVGVPMKAYASTTPAVSRLKWLYKRIRNWRTSSDKASVV